MNDSERIEVTVVGVFRVATAGGEDITPTGLRPRAVLAAILLSPRKMVSRRWLETLLWADRGPEQASGSLRQALTNIRKCFGPNAHVLQANRSDVWLDGDVTVDVLDDKDTTYKMARRGRDLLEGFDIRSEPFEDWLRLERTRFHEALPKDPDPLPALAEATALNGSEKAQKPVVLAEVHGGSSPLATLFADSIRTQLGKTASEFMRTEVIMADDQTVDAVYSPGSRCTIRVAESSNDIIALSHLTDSKSGRLIWSRQIRFDAGESDAANDAIAALAFEASEVIAETMDNAGDAARANALAASGLKDAFTFDIDRLDRADKLLARANDLEAHAPRPALRALVRGFIALEQAEQNSEEVMQEVSALLDSALTIEKDNSLALAFLADVQDLVFMDSIQALSYAKRALAINPGTGYAHASLGALELRRDRPGEALAAATRAKAQLEHTSLAVFSLMRFCVAAISDGKFAEAEAAAERAAILAPDSRPPLRHLYALRLHLGDMMGAREALLALRRLEPDFSLAYVRQNPEYPAHTLRKYGLLNQVEPDF